MSEHEHDDEPAFGIAIPIPACVRQAHDRQHMKAEDRAAAVDRLLDGLDVEQLLALRTILNLANPERMNQYIDGQVVTLLRRIHGVDSSTGLTPQETLEREANRG